MNPVAVAFVVLAGLSAAIAACIASRAAAAGATLAFSATAFLIAASAGLNASAKLIVPVTTGAAMAALVVLPLVALRPRAPAWGRVTLGAGTALTAHLAYIHFALQAR